MRDAAELKHNGDHDVQFAPTTLRSAFVWWGKCADNNKPIPCKQEPMPPLFPLMLVSKRPEIGGIQEKIGLL